jgi:hypothetical protein
MGGKIWLEVHVNGGKGGEWGLGAGVRDIHFASFRREISMNCLMSLISEGILDQRSGVSMRGVIGYHWVFLKVDLCSADGELSLRALQMRFRAEETLSGDFWGYVSTGRTLGLGALLLPYLYAESMGKKHSWLQ